MKYCTPSELAIFPTYSVIKPDRTTATGGLTSDTVYYLAGVQSVEDGETSTTETVYTLESTVGKENKITSVYGTPIALTVQQQTVTNNGIAVTAGS